MDLAGITTFEMEYGHWVEEQHRQNIELRKALQDHATEIELRIRVESGLNHYATLFRMKADAAKADIFYLLSGIWRTSVERYFHWIGGFRPSELLNVNLLELGILRLLSYLLPLSCACLCMCVCGFMYVSYIYVLLRRMGTEKHTDLEF